MWTVSYPVSIVVLVAPESADESSLSSKGQPGNVNHGFSRISAVGLGPFQDLGVAITVLW